MSLLLTLNYFTPCSSASIVNFEHVIAGWDTSIYYFQDSRKYCHRMKLELLNALETKGVSNALE